MPVNPSADGTSTAITPLRTGSPGVRQELFLPGPPCPGPLNRGDGQQVAVDLCPGGADPVRLAQGEYPQRTPSLGDH
eukprot:CAMPEP_0174301270 /NCGR_PEP_ID=MMETSP0809-20121228/58953_1 /TAXON_ID=73025 ORGANISM="Eutreptiella gymnastica-like, Strain CCMP1594" /NCGR_SAMPLE_ID=MMETSP0809 /ASSEMBLY_ACC=CAM_ASM_000658 /LENGTH=76 /DNA_ID=CAMNT_0015406995 /DNA_START=467 /DNA_END=697 /DNA_ORIENTATION=+